MRSPCPERLPSSPMPSEEVVVARSASGQALPSCLSSSTLGSISSRIASITRSHSSRSSGLVVTFTLPGSPPSTLAQRLCACSSARQADASERASSIVLETELAQAASPQAIAPLPAMAGFRYSLEALTEGKCYHASVRDAAATPLVDSPVNRVSLGRSAARRP